MSRRFRIASTLAATAAAVTLMVSAPSASADSMSFSSGHQRPQAASETRCKYIGHGWYDCTDYECSSGHGVKVCTPTDHYYKKAGSPTHFPGG